MDDVLVLGNVIGYVQNVTIDLDRKIVVIVGGGKLITVPCC